MEPLHGWKNTPPHPTPGSDCWVWLWEWSERGRDVALIVFDTDAIIL